MPTLFAWIALGALTAEAFTVSAIRPWDRTANGPVLGLAIGGAGLALLAAVAATLPDPIPLVTWWALLAPVALTTSMVAVGSALLLALHPREVYAGVRRWPARTGAACVLIGVAALTVIAIVIAPLLSQLPSLGATACAFLAAHALWLAGYTLSPAREAR